MTIVAAQLNSTAISTAQTQAASIANAITAPAVTSGQFVYFAAFDGTNNDRDAVWKSGNQLSTNVGALERQVNLATTPGGNVASNYFAGPGTGGVTDPSAVFPTDKIISIANAAYDDFARRASDWLAVNPGGEVTAAFVSFSRGGAVAAVFSQLLYGKGLIDPKTGEVLIPPGKVGISAGLALEPVETLVGGNMAFAPNAKNVVVVRAQNEYRDLFKATDYTDQPGVTTLMMMGNHCDIGGGYDNGLGALMLAAGTQLIRNAGIAIQDVSADRQFSPAQAVIHDESYEDVLNYDTGQMVRRQIWGSYGSVSSGTERRIDTSRVVTNASTQVTPDGSVISTFTNYLGQQVVVTTSKNLDGSSRAHNELTSPPTDQGPGQILSESYVDTSADGLTVTLSTWNGSGGWQQTTTTRIPYDDGSSIVQIRYPSGAVLVASYDTERKLAGRDFTTLLPNGAEQTVHSALVNGNLIETYRTTAVTDDEGSRIVATQYSDGRWNTTTFNSDGTLFQRVSSTPLGSETVRYDASGNPSVTVVRQGRRRRQHT